MLTDFEDVVLDTLLLFVARVVVVFALKECLKLYLVPSMVMEPDTASALYDPYVDLHFSVTLTVAVVSDV